jgi:hypothetical protein
MTDTNWNSMANAAAILRDITYSDQSAQMIVATHLEAANATTTSMIDIIDGLMAEKPHLFWASAKQRPMDAKPDDVPTVNPFKPGSGWNMTKQHELLKTQPELAERLRAVASR